MEKTLAFNDEVWHRVVQVVQEAILTGVDCTELLREIRVTEGTAGDLVLTEAYKTQVKEKHAEMVARAASLQNASKVILKD